MGKSNSKSQSTDSQFVFVSSSTPYSGSTAQSQLRNAESSIYSSGTPGRRNDAATFSSYGNANTATGARPKQYQAPSYPSGTRQQSWEAYPGLLHATPKQKKPLYMASSMESLSKGIDRGINCSNSGSLVGKAEVAIIAADAAYEQKDEERAYIWYSRYALMWAHIRESSDYKNKPITFDNKLGVTNIQRAFDRKEELATSLEVRYIDQAFSSQMTASSTGPQIPAVLTRNTNSSLLGLPQRQTFQLERPGSSSSKNTASSSSLSNSRNTYSTPSQKSFNTRPTGPTYSQTSSNSRRTDETPSQPKAGGSVDQREATGTGRQQQSSVAKKDLQSGVMRGLRANLDCPICLDWLRNAKNLPCGHIICEECIGQWVSSKGGVLSCPTCKTRHSLPLNGVAGLPTNFVLNNLVAEMKKLEDGESEEEVEEDQPPIKPITLPQVEMGSPQTRLPGVASAKTSFLEKTTKSYKDVKGSIIRLRVQLCDFEGTNVRGGGYNNVEATVCSPTKEKEIVSVNLMRRDGDYCLSFTPSKVGIHLVEAYLDKKPVVGSPLKVVVHPSVKFDGLAHSGMDHPTDVVVNGSMVYATDKSEYACRSCKWQSDESFRPYGLLDESVTSFGIAVTNDIIYVTVPCRGCVNIYDKTGSYINSFGKTVLKLPTGIAVSREGVIYVAESVRNTINIFRSDFTHTHSIHAGGNAKFCSLNLLALNSAGDRLIAVDQGTDCFKIFDVVNMGLVKMIKTRIQQAPAKPFGVEVDGDGNILVSVTYDPSKQNKKVGKDQQNIMGRSGAVIMYNSNGYFLGKFGDNELKDPRGLCIVGDRLIVVENEVEVSGCLKVYSL